jgi:hypothetical protein
MKAGAARQWFKQQHFKVFLTTCNVAYQWRLSETARLERGTPQ